MLPAAHLGETLTRIQRIVTLAAKDRAPLTEHEAFEQIVEELELAGFGRPELDDELREAARELERRHH